MPDELNPSTNIEKFLAKTAGESVELPEPATRIEQYLNKIASEQSIVSTTESWLAEHINPQTGYAVDNTLSVAGAAADAKATGDALTAQSAKIDGVSQEYSGNLFNGEYNQGYRAGKSIYSVSDNYSYSKPIYLQAGNYLFSSAQSVVGASNGNRAFIVDSEGICSDSIEATVIGQVTYPYYYNNRNVASVSVPDGYYSFNLGGKSIIDVLSPQPSNFMLIKGSQLSEFTKYIPYFDPFIGIKSTVPLSEKMIETVNGLNGLIGKTAIFDGDSICQGISVGQSDDSYGLGYAGRIGNVNEMEWHNYGKSGGVISSASTSGMSGKYSVYDNVDTMHTQFPNADFIIFEGGTNDADIIGDAIANPSIMGTLTENDYSGSYDTATFTGALETIFYKSIGYWKGKKIGYIVAYKMGYGYSNFDKDHANRRAYFERAMDVCKKWGIPFLNLWDDCYLNPKNANLYDSTKTIDENISGGYLYTDGQHLTAKGYDYISPIIEAWMKTL